MGIIARTRYNKPMTAILEKPITRGAIEMPLMRVDLRLYDRMIEAGIFDSGHSVELLEGLILEREPMKPLHYTRVKHIYDRLLSQFENLATVYSEVPIELPNDGRPQPDIVLADIGAGELEYTRPNQVHLLIEVADSSLERDRDFKGFLYARDGIREYWIVDLNAGNLEVYRNPNQERYENVITVKSREFIACLAFPEIKIDWS